MPLSMSKRVERASPEHRPVWLRSAQPPLSVPRALPRGCTDLSVIRNSGRLPLTTSSPSVSLSRFLVLSYLVGVKHVWLFTLHFPDYRTVEHLFVY